MFVIRYDLRVPPGVHLTHADQYRTAIEMANWADERGFAAVALSEHHDTDDGFMSSPLTIAAAILGSTNHLLCNISALLVPLHDPIRLAEEIATIDLIAPGRLSVVAGLGYRPSEFEMFGKDLRARAKDFEEAIALMLAAWAGGEVTYRGRRVRVMPLPATKPHPDLRIGGSVPAAARRAARLRLPYVPALHDPELTDIYLAEAARIGFDAPLPAVGTGPGLVLVTPDPDRLWARIGDQLLYDAQVYMSWQGPQDRSSWKTPADTVDDLRASPHYAIVTPEQCVELVRQHGAAILHPLVAGIDPAIGWESLELVAAEVMPAVAAQARTPSTSAS
jgi:alkanesulfonate monooxygenase SsuD/methylene tetrahydromethanopterin reductase-like flavin-dependent oxidoreductase (luciferase family)